MLCTHWRTLELIDDVSVNHHHSDRVNIHTIDKDNREKNKEDGGSVWRVVPADRSRRLALGYLKITENKSPLALTELGSVTRYHFHESIPQIRIQFLPNSIDSVPRKMRKFGRFREYQNECQSQDSPISRNLNH